MHILAPRDVSRRLLKGGGRSENNVIHTTLGFFPLCVTNEGGQEIFFFASWRRGPSLVTGDTCAFFFFVDIYFTPSPPRVVPRVASVQEKEREREGDRRGPPAVFSRAQFLAIVLEDLEELGAITSRRKRKSVFCMLRVPSIIISVYATFIRSSASAFRISLRRLFAA